MRKQSKRYLFLFCMLAVLFMGLSGTGVAFAHGHTQLASLQKAPFQTCGAWSVETSPYSDPSQLNGIAAVSANDVWAVGYYHSNTGVQSLIEQWNGTNWSVVLAHTGTALNQLNAVAAVSANDIWAVGYYYNSNTNNQRTLIEQWNGTTWSIVPSPNNDGNDNQLWGVAAVSANDVWAVGNYSNSSTGITRNLTMNWNGTNWSLVPTPNAASSTNVLTGVAAISASDVWAVGYYERSNGTEVASTLHWNGTKWSSVNPNAPFYSGLYGVAAVSTSDVWAVGNQYSGGTIPLTMNWNGTKWSVVTSPNDGLSQLDSLAVVSASDVWAVGYYYGGPTLIEQWNGTNWSVVSSPSPGVLYNELLAVAADTSGDVWAVGYYINDFSYNEYTLIESYC